MYYECTKCGRKFEELKKLGKLKFCGDFWKCTDCDNDITKDLKSWIQEVNDSFDDFRFQPKVTDNELKDSLLDHCKISHKQNKKEFEIIPRRPIKFRFYDLNEKKFVYSDKIDLETQLFRLHAFLGNAFKNGNYNVHLQQFTGLQDKSGKEIYEGDILKYSANYAESLGGQLCCDIDKVEFYSGGYFGWKGDLLCDFSENGKKLYLEIIGNSYENPELLK